MNYLLSLPNSIALCNNAFVMDFYYDMVLVRMNYLVSVFHVDKLIVFGFILL
jgi:hypothetical protein